MEFHVYETKETIRAVERPIVVITSNNEKELPDAFLRRCFFHYIRFPDADTMARIVEVHYPGIKRRLVEEALRLFFEVRDYTQILMLADRHDWQAPFSGELRCTSTGARCWWEASA